MLNDFQPLYQITILLQRILVYSAVTALGLSHFQYGLGSQAYRAYI